MKKLSMMKKVMLSVCAIICGVFCFGAISTHNTPSQENYIQAKAETVSSSSMKWVVNSASATLDYVYVYFDGFNTKVNYDYNSGDMANTIFGNILINGTSILEINATTDVSGWSWDIFPQTEQAGYRKPVISYIGGTASSNKYIELRIHKNLTDAMIAKDGYFMMTVKEGFTVNDYTLDKETSYRLKDDKSALSNAAKTPTIDWRGSYDNSSYMDYLYVGFAGFTTKDDYEGNANSDYVFQNILLNEKSLYEINNTTDTTGWVWDTFPP